MHVQLEFCWIALQYLNIVQTYKCTSFILLLLVVVASELFGSNYWLFKYRDREVSIKILKCIWGWNARVKIITCLICDIFVLDNSFPHFNHWSKIVTFILYFMNTKKTYISLLHAIYKIRSCHEPAGKPTYETSRNCPI